jgi:hypothetical protein
MKCLDEFGTGDCSGHTQRSGDCSSYEKTFFTKLPLEKKRRAMKDSMKLRRLKSFKSLGASVRAKKKSLSSNSCHGDPKALSASLRGTLKSPSSHGRLAREKEQRSELQTMNAIIAGYEVDNSTLLEDAQFLIEDNDTLTRDISELKLMYNVDIQEREEIQEQVDRHNSELLEDSYCLLMDNHELVKELEEVERERDAAVAGNKILKDQLEESQFYQEQRQHEESSVFDESSFDNGIFRKLKKSGGGTRHNKNTSGRKKHGCPSQVQASSTSRSFMGLDWHANELEVIVNGLQAELVRKSREWDMERQRMGSQFNKDQDEIDALREVAHKLLQSKHDDNKIIAELKSVTRASASCPGENEKSCWKPQESVRDKTPDTGGQSVNGGVLENSSISLDLHEIPCVSKHIPQASLRHRMSMALSGISDRLQDTSLSINPNTTTGGSSSSCCEVNFFPREGRRNIKNEDAAPQVSSSSLAMFLASQVLPRESSESYCDASSTASDDLKRGCQLLKEISNSAGDSFVGRSSGTTKHEEAEALSRGMIPTINGSAAHIGSARLVVSQTTNITFT